MKLTRHSPALTVARYTLLEAVRSSLPWLSVACLCGALGLAGFLSNVAITEAAALQAVGAGTLLRACAVFLIAVHVVASVTREANDKGLEHALALPISRQAWYFGKLVGFSCAGGLVATLFALPLLFWAKAPDLSAWWISLVAETTLVAAAAMFFASAMAQAAAAMAAVAGLYVLGRSISAIQAIADTPLAQDSAASRGAGWVLDGLALLAPKLDGVTRSDWLLYGAPPAGELALLLAGLVLYVLLLAVAGVFDFSRRNL